MRNQLLTAASVVLLCAGSSAEDRIDLSTFSGEVERFAEMRRKIAIPTHLWEKNMQRHGPKFDLAAYFNIFKHVHMKPGRALDWVYSYGESSGKPIIYARGTAVRPFSKLSELRESVKEEAELDEVEAIWEDHLKRWRKKGLSSDARRELQKERDARLTKHPRRKYWDWWKEEIRTDGTDQAFLELGALHLLADLFALSSHSRGAEIEILPDRAAIKRLADQPLFEHGEYRLHLPGEIARRALELNPSPSVRREETRVVVTFLTFTKWGGFARTTLKITRDPPHKIVSQREKTEVVFYLSLNF